MVKLKCLVFLEISEDLIGQFLGSNIILLLIALFIIISIFLGVRIVPQSQKFVVERFGRLQSVLGPGINFIIPFLDRVRHRVSILERQLPNASQDAITSDNVLVQVETSVFYRITEPEEMSRVFGPLTRYKLYGRKEDNANWEIDLSKTGFLREAGRCLVMRARIDGEPISIVLLNSYGKLTPFGDSNRLKRWLLSNS